MPAGRPTIWNQKLIKEVAECFLDGFSDAETALMTGINEKTIRRARAAEFCPEIKKAELGRKRFYVKKARDSSGPDWTRVAWWLERRWPEQFSKPEVQMNLNMQHNTTHQTLIIVAEQAKEIAGRVDEADTKWNQLLKAKNVTPNGNGHSHPEAKS